MGARTKKRHRHKWKWFEGYAGAEINWCESCGVLTRHYGYRQHGRTAVEWYRPKNESPV